MTQIENKLSLHGATIKTYEDLREWAEKELEELEWVGNATTGFKHPNRIYLKYREKYLDPLNNIINASNEIIKFENSNKIQKTQNIKSNISAVKNSFERYPQKHDTRSGGYRLFKKLLDEGREEPEVLAAGFLLQDSVSDNKETRAEVYACLYKMFNERVLYDRSDIEDRKIVEDWKNTLSQDSKYFNDQYESKISEFEKEIQSTKAKIDSRLEEIDQAENERISKFEESMDAMEKYHSDLKEKLKYTESIEHWKKKSREHLAAMITMWTLFISLMILYSLEVIIKPSDDVTNLNYYMSSTFWESVVFLGLFIWAERLLAKIAISNMHLRNDAEERVTMLQTYLALKNEDSGDEIESDVLKSVFTPTTSGLVKEADSGHIAEVLIKQLGPK